MAILVLQACGARLGRKAIQVQKDPLVKMGQKGSLANMERTERLVNLANLAQKVMMDLRESQDMQDHQEQKAVWDQRAQLEPKD